MSNKRFNTTAIRTVRRLLIALVIIISICAAGAPAQAAAQTSGRTIAHRAAAQTGTVTIQISKIEYNAVVSQERGMLIHMYVEMYNLDGTPMRVAVFFNYSSDDTPLPADPNAPTDFVTTDGNLTAQIVVTPAYQDTYWDNFQLFVPYAAFPGVSEVTDVYVYPAVGIDGQDFAVYGDRVDFHINP